MIEKYRGIAPEGVLTQISVLARALRGRSLLHINSTRTGGGVAEILSRLVPWTESLGINTRWDVVNGTQPFFEVTKTIHNALQGADQEITDSERQIYLDNIRENAGHIKLDSDVVIIHDPQPAYLINYCAADSGKLVWRCHIDLSHPNPATWRFLRQAVRKYDAVLFHVPNFTQTDLDVPQIIIAPSIDPLADKNRELSEEEITSVTDKYGIDRGRPIIVQISRFDRFKDPLGVIRAFAQIRRHFDCQLVLAGGEAADDPEGPRVRAEVEQAAAGDPDIFVLKQPGDVEVNALQRAATIVFQKSLKEGFGLTVTEAMWKSKPVIAGAVGGIPSQIIQGITGYLVHSPEGAAFRARYLLSHPEESRQMGKRAYEHVRHNFLITRDVKDHLLLMLNLLEGKEDKPMLLPSTDFVELGQRPGNHT